jgi:hypothetical protein
LSQLPFLGLFITILKTESQLPMALAYLGLFLIGLAAYFPFKKYSKNY